MSRSPADVIKSLPTPKVLERLITWHRHYRKHFDGRFQGIHLNLKLLRHAVENSLLDLARMKNFHGIEFADCHKCAALSMLWIARAHPIQLATDVNMTEALLVINEYFAIHIGLNRLSIDITQVSKNYLRNLVYILHYRNPAPELLASSMYLLEHAVKKDGLP